MYRSPYFHDDDDDGGNFFDSFFPWPVWFIIPCVIILILLVCCVIGVIIKMCCCRNRSSNINPPVRVTHAHTMEPSHGATTAVATAPYYEPTSYGISHIPYSYPYAYNHQINGKTYDWHGVSNHTSQSHSVYQDLPPSYAVAVGSASAAPCTSDSAAGFTALDSGVRHTSHSGAGFTTHT